MKRIALLLFAMVAMCANAQEIIQDETSSRGARTIVCSNEIASIGKNEISIGLSFTRAKDFDMYSLNIGVKRNRLIHVVEGGKITFIQEDGTKIILKNFFDETSYSFDGIHSANLVCEITSTQLGLLMAGAKSIQIQTTTGLMEEPLNQDRLIKNLLMEFDLIHNKL